MGIHITQWKETGDGSRWRNWGKKVRNGMKQEKWTNGSELDLHVGCGRKHRDMWDCGCHKVEGSQ